MVLSSEHFLQSAWCVCRWHCVGTIALGPFGMSLRTQTETCSIVVSVRPHVDILSAEAADGPCL
jgi:hypothetical protein